MPRTAALARAGALAESPRSRPATNTQARDRASAEAWQAGEDTSPDEVFGLHRQESDRAKAVIAATSFTAPADWPQEWPDGRLANLREVMLHVTTETACHAGEWMVLT